MNTLRQRLVDLELAFAGQLLDLKRDSELRNSITDANALEETRKQYALIKQALNNDSEALMKVLPLLSDTIH